jgi:tRNA pseudouridine38-40 synthase
MESVPIHSKRSAMIPSKSVMPHWKLTLAYDGTPYNGWQVQPNLPTVQGTLASVIQYITGETVLPQGSGRTDAGVHALAQVATFSLNVPIPAINLQRALNRALPASIRVLSVEVVPEDFHARHSALRKTYEYRILPCGRDESETARICSPMLAPYVWPCRYALDLSILQQAAAYILGTHDFTSFAANDPDQTARSKSEEKDVALVSSSSQNLKNVISTEGGTLAAAEKSPRFSAGETSTVDAALCSDALNNIRTIYSSTWHQQEDLLIYRVTGNGFLHHMVRNLVGTFVEAAANRIPDDAIPSILAARNRSAGGPTAPASGLFLVEVEY